MKNIILNQVIAILDDKDILASLCNLTALLNENINDINWIGFYFLKDNELVLGPFQGRVACSCLTLDKGVCAHAFNHQELTIIDNVHEFQTHIACDSRTNSELVSPIIIDNQCIGVLDVDSISFNRFKKEDGDLFKEISILIANKIKAAK